MRYVVLIKKYGYIKELRFPVDLCVFTEDEKEAQRFADKEWIKTKFDWYIGEGNYWIKEISVEKKGQVMKNRDITKQIKNVKSYFHKTVLYWHLLSSKTEEEFWNGVINSEPIKPKTKTINAFRKAKKDLYGRKNYVAS